jgi:hypothetical protein
MRSFYVPGPFALSLALSPACADPSPTNFTDGGADTLAIAGMTYTWSFDDNSMPPAFFNVLGDWKVEAGELVQTGDFPSPDYPRLVIEDLSAVDFHLSVRCKVERGDTDRACGLLFRAEDSDNYMLTRANALEDNIRLYTVVGGGRSQFASTDKSVTSGEWHELEVDAQGAQLVVLWDGAEVMSETNDTFTRGAIGVWTKADSVTRFDDLVLVAR